MDCRAWSKGKEGESWDKDGAWKKKSSLKWRRILPDGRDLFEVTWLHVSWIRVGG